MVTSELFLTKRLTALTNLTVGDIAIIENCVKKGVRWLAPHEEIMAEGEPASAVHILLDGWAIASKQLSDGRRQILTFLLPGDLCGLHADLLDRADHSVGALTHARIAAVAPTDLEALKASSPRIAKAFQLSELTAASIQRAWLTCLGQCSAYERIAHLLCELHARMSIVGLVENGECELPVTQHDLADAAGLTPVHVNRTLQQLRHDALIELGERRLKLCDPKRLAAAAAFDPPNLHHRQATDKARVSQLAE